MAGLSPQRRSMHQRRYNFRGDAGAILPDCRTSISSIVFFIFGESLNFCDEVPWATGDSIREPSRGRQVRQIIMESESKTKDKGTQKG
jgi:hypothetical protein